MPIRGRRGSIGTPRSADREPGSDHRARAFCLHLARRKVNPCLLVSRTAWRRCSSRPPRWWAPPHPRRTAAPAALPDPGDAALDWIEGELVADGGVLTSSFDDGMGGVGSFVDYGLTIDAILALAADGRGDEEVATVADGLVEDALASYITAARLRVPR